MVLVYTEAITARLQYSCSFLLEEQLGLAYEITTDKELFTSSPTAKLAYCKEKPSTDCCWIKPCGLLTESDIRPQQPACFDTGKYKAVFPVSGCDWKYDLLAAIFYLLSRYEEYLPHTLDMYGRYAHENALAYKEGFLQQPLINYWIKDFAGALQQQYPHLVLQQRSFHFQPTYDIDIAWSYRHKGFTRSLGGFLKQPSLQRLKVLLGQAPDPFDSYAWLDQLHRQYQLQPLYFFLLANTTSAYDKNIAPSHPAMQAFVHTHAQRYPTGIHPSWQSGDRPALLKEEIQLLEKMTGRTVTASRQHYIRFTLPQGYRRLIAAGITDDYSMGYGSINGFRASFAGSFYWYDLEKEVPTRLLLHPFCYMDANSFYEQRFSAQQAYEEMLHYYNQCKATGGKMISIWHNNFTGTAPLYKGWREAYEQFIAQVRQ